ncbi:hypothetical protein ACB098_09G034600 [Castanea mollissima]
MIRALPRYRVFVFLEILFFLGSSCFPFNPNSKDLLVLSISEKKRYPYIYICLRVVRSDCKQVSSPRSQKLGRQYLQDKCNDQLS